MAPQAPWVLPFKLAAPPGKSCGASAQLEQQQQRPYNEPATVVIDRQRRGR